jgi:signal transduction histidine kinase
MGIRSLVSRSLAEVRLSQGVQNLEQFLVSPFIEELVQGARLEAHSKNVTLNVTPVEDGVMIGADRQVLASVVENLLQNAFKFTRPGTVVTLRVGASAERVLIEIQDECGGLQGGMSPSFSVRSSSEVPTGLAWV